MSAQPQRWIYTDDLDQEFWDGVGDYHDHLEAAYWSAGGPSAVEAERQQQDANRLLSERY